MKITELKSQYENYYDVIKMTDLEHMFNIYEDEHGDYKYNLNTTLYVDALSYDTYTLNHDLLWPTISYKIYGTTHLAWLLIKINNVLAADVFEYVKAGLTIRYLLTSDVQQIIDLIY